MTWNFATPGIWFSISAALFFTGLAIYSGRRSNVPGATPFVFACLFAALSAACFVMRFTTEDPTTRIFWFKLNTSIQLPLLFAITGFFLDYTWPGRWLTRRNVALLIILILLADVLLLTNEYHHLLWLDLLTIGSVEPQWGPSGWFLSVTVLGILTIVNLIACGWLFLHSPQHRLPVVIMLIGQFVGRTVFLLVRGDILNSILPLELLGKAIEFLMYAIALFGFHILDPIPLARQAAIEQLHAGVLVLDPQGKIVTLNPAASSILGLPAVGAIGRLVRELLPAYGDLEGSLQAAGVSRVEIRLLVGRRDTAEGGSETRYYQVETSSLIDWRGLTVGRLLLIHDMTEQKKAQAQMLEQQRAQAMLHERDQLARELHDNLGQVFAFINAQGQSIQRLLTRGEVATAGEYVGRLVEAARQADVDIRESILGLRADISKKGFFPALEQYLTQYETYYGISTTINKPETIPDGIFDPLVEVQLLRIVQEALTNVRKHACANRVHIAFSSEDGVATIVIEDDGQGFDPGVRRDSSDGHVGLRVMSERAEEVGGSLILHSQPGQGTEVIVRVPMRAVENELKDDFLVS